MTETPLFDRVAEGPPILTVSELTAQVQAVLDQVFPVVWVAEEVVTFKPSLIPSWQPWRVGELACVARYTPAERLVTTCMDIMG